jgi:hypothetical protein
VWEWLNRYKFVTTDYSRTLGSQGVYGFSLDSILWEKEGPEAMGNQIPKVGKRKFLFFPNLGRRTDEGRKNWENYFLPLSSLLIQRRSRSSSKTYHFRPREPMRVQNK